MSDNKWKYVLPAYALKNAPWYGYHHKIKHLPEDYDRFIAHLGITNEDLAYYLKVLRASSYKYSWHVIKELNISVKHKSGTSNDNDINKFISAFGLLIPEQGRIKPSKLYGLYYHWSELPVSRRDFSNHFGRNTYVSIPSETSITRAFLQKMKDAHELQQERKKQRTSMFFEICYGRQEEKTPMGNIQPHSEEDPQRSF